MPTSLKDTITLHIGVNMPLFGLGVYKAQDGDKLGLDYPCRSESCHHDG